MTMDNNTALVLLTLVAAALVAFRVANRPKTPTPVRDPRTATILAEIQAVRDELRREAPSGFATPAKDDQEGK